MSSPSLSTIVRGVLAQWRAEAENDARIRLASP
jgi:hypothetical protein